ncbi:MAG: hypothetical protein JWR80_1891 [Bradyrhizobium sp.]|nr:hypothetical protein [Bradyrhizobium sp.]
MTKLRFLGAAVILSTALAAPALAQEVIEDPGYCAQFYPNANCQNLGPGNPYTRSNQRGADHRDSNARWDDGRRSSRDTGFWPGEVVAGAAGAAVGTAGAIATAPFRGDSSAYYNNGDRSWSQSYAQRNGFVCQPGTWFVGQDGLRHICQ